MDISPELARVHAHLCGDGSVLIYKTNERNRKFKAEIGYYNNNQRLLDNFRNDFSKLFGVKMKMRSNRSVTISSIKRYHYFINTFGDFGSRKWRIHNSIQNACDSIKLEWLKAFFEDEAYHEKRYDRLKTKSMSYEGLKDTKQLLDSMNIFCTLTGPNCDESYYLTIPKFSKVPAFNEFVKEPARKKNSSEWI